MTKLLSTTMRRIELTVIFILSTVLLNAQPKEPKSVAIFLFDGVELLDFAEAGEVFSAAGLKTFTVSVDGKEILSQAFVKVIPEFSIENAPVPDIIVLPGGQGGAPKRMSNDPRVIDWVQKMHGKGTPLMSICAATFILAKGGFLEGKRATTHWSVVKYLAAAYPSVTVLDNERFVDNGTIISTAGVTAGIDGSLHFVSRLQGLDAAKRVARYMEYDKWNPEDGVVDIKNAVIEKLRIESATLDNGANTKVFESGDVGVVYEGEILNLATELVQKGSYREAAYVVEAGTKFFPNSAPLYAIRSVAYKKLNRPGPIEESALIQLMKEKKIEEALARYQKDSKAFPNWKIVRESELQDAASWFSNSQKDYLNAVKIFQFASKVYPESASVQYFLGINFKNAGKKSEAIEAFKKCAQLDHGYEEYSQREIQRLQAAGEQ